MNIIPHNEPFDLNSFINELKAQRGDLDYHVFQNFFEDGSIVHAFTGFSYEGNRISSALGDAILSHEGNEAMVKAKSVAIIVSYSQLANHLLKVSELQSIPKLMELVPYNGELTWNMLYDNTLGDTVKLRVFVKI